MTYLNVDRKKSRCMKPWCRQVIDNTRAAKQSHDLWHATINRKEKTS